MAWCYLCEPLDGDNNENAIQIILSGKEPGNFLVMKEYQDVAKEKEQ